MGDASVDFLNARPLRTVYDSLRACFAFEFARFLLRALHTCVRLAERILARILYRVFTRELLQTRRRGKDCEEVMTYVSSRENAEGFTF